MPPPLLRTKSLFAPAVQNPFVAKLEIPWYRKLQMVLAAITLVPIIRVLLSFLCLIMAWIFGSILLIGVSAEELTTVPFTGWRKRMKGAVLFWCRASFFCFGIYRKVIGQPAGQKEASAIVMAPHSSFFDVGCGLTFDEVPYAVSRSENMDLPIIGVIMKITQSVFVYRGDKDSRHKTIAQLKSRAQSGGVWPQLILFPEGTTTNGKALITFKQGAFIPGMPVQPIIVRYPDSWDTVTWAWEGPGVGLLLWMSLSRLWTTMEIECLPVYTPSEAEKNDASLYADNVRKVMAAALKVPVTDHSYEDCRLMEYAKKANLKMGDALVEFRKMQKKLGLSYEDIHSLLDKFSKISNLSDDSGRVDLHTFAKYMDLPVSETLKQLFSIYDRDNSGNIDFREYVIGMSLISEPARADEPVRLAFKLFDKENKGYVTSDEFADLLLDILYTERSDADTLYAKLDTSKSGKVTFDDFKAYAEDMPEYAALFTTYYSIAHDSDPSVLERRSRRDLQQDNQSSESDRKGQRSRSSSANRASPTDAVEKPKTD